MVVSNNRVGERYRKRERELLEFSWYIVVGAAPKVLGISQTHLSGSIIQKRLISEQNYIKSLFFKVPCNH